MTTQSTSTVLEASRLGLSFSHNGNTGHKHVLRDISLQVSRGEIVALLGKSGAGKTSLLNIIAGFAPLQRGSLRFASEQTAAHPPFSYVFQEDRLLPWRTALGNVSLALERIGTPRADRDRLALAALADVGLEAAAGQFPWQLSGGMRSRVALARALALQAPLLLLDEPFGKLDAATRGEMHALLRQLQERHGFGALLVTHDIGEAAALAQRAMVLHAGVPGLLEVPLAADQQASEALLRQTLLAPAEPAAAPAAAPAGAPGSIPAEARRASAPASNEPVMATRRTAMALGAAAFSTAALSCSSRAWSQARAPLRIGYWATGIQLALIELIRERKLFEKHGLDYELVRFADVNGNTLALATDRIDVAFSVSGAGALDLASKKRPVRIVLSTQAADGRLVTNKPDIRNVGDLRGRIVGMAPAGSAGAAYTKAFLAKNHGLAADAYRTVGGGEARLVQLLVQGEIDAALLREVSVIQFKDRLKLHALADQRAEWGRLAGAGAVPPLGMGVVTQKILSSRREDAVGFIAAVIEGIRTGSAQPALVSELMARTLKLPPEEAGAYARTWGISFHGKFEDADVASLDAAQKLFVASGGLESVADRAWFDQSVYRDALKRLA
ncbi:ATP-binding cassette domain-containing protein [Lacisediminimonas profundi]|uniref:ATP-binding cassette domain-containing protein n=1 Tax=Lacisediminimonas profundi TaxID=2603856 RepID=UPI00124B6844|nr:ATP-binding cassette domain-containing protein [Lacisediminimonas profundi]